MRPQGARNGRCPNEAAVRNACAPTASNGRSGGPGEQVGRVFAANFEIRISRLRRIETAGAQAPRPLLDVVLVEPNCTASVAQREATMSRADTCRRNAEFCDKY